MVVVAIIGVLAALGIGITRQRAHQADIASGVAIVRSIAAAEENYRALNQVYLDVSTAGDAGWYPRADIPTNTKVSFWTEGGDTPRWRELAPDVRQSVAFGFKANAGLPGAALPALATTQFTLPPTSPTEPWYLIQARGFAERDDTRAFIVFASWSPEIRSIREGE